MSRTVLGDCAVFNRLTASLSSILTFFQSVEETEKFHRPKVPPSFEYFTEEMIEAGNQHIQEVDDLLARNDLPRFSSEEYQKEEKKDSLTDSAEEKNRKKLEVNAQ